MTVKKYNVLIIGAGQIGAFYDAPDSSNILTHAHAFSVTGGFELIGFVDVDPVKGQEAANRWNTQCFESLDEAFAKHSIDVVCVAVPDKFHEQTLRELLKYPVRFVFAEKPFCGDPVIAKELSEAFADKNIAIQVNYTRRFVPEFQELAHKIQAGAFGECLGGVGYYGKGFIHNGSHMINLLQFLFGSHDLKIAQVLNTLMDEYPNDPSIGLQLELPNQSTFTLQVVDSRAVTLFEFDLLFERQRVRMLKSGFMMYYFDTAENETFAGYRNYIMKDSVDTKLGKAMRYAAENIKAHLDNHSALVSPVSESIETLEILALVKNKIQSNKATLMKEPLFP